MVRKPVISVIYSRFAYLTNLVLLRLSIVSYKKQEYTCLYYTYACFTYYSTRNRESSVTKVFNNGII